VVLSLFGLGGFSEFVGLVLDQICDLGLFHRLYLGLTGSRLTLLSLLLYLAQGLAAGDGDAHFAGREGK